MGLFNRKKKIQDKVKGELTLLELQKTIAMVKIIALDLQTTADDMEEKVEDIKKGIEKTAWKK
jgi:hypothetical protein